MAKWICVMRQKGDGCDYSIGCGVKVAEVEANDFASAKAAALKATYLDEYTGGKNDPSYYINGEGALKSLRLFEVSEEMDLMPFLHEAHKTYIMLGAEAEKSEKLAQFEKLREELGK